MVDDLPKGQNCLAAWKVWSAWARLAWAGRQRGQSGLFKYTRAGFAYTGETPKAQGCRQCKNCIISPSPVIMKD